MKKIAPKISLTRVLIRLEFVLLFTSICTVLNAQPNVIGPGIAIKNNGNPGNYVDLGDVFNSLQFPITFEAWIKPNSTPSPLYGIFTTENDNAVYSGLWVRMTSVNGIEFEIGDGLGSGPGYRRGFRTTVSLELLKWTHIAIVANSITDVKFYFNGNLVNQNPSDGTSNVLDMVSSSSKAYIGRHLNIFSDLFFDGEIDEIRLWKINRSQTEIRENMCKKIIDQPIGLIGYWKIDESYSSTSVIDYAPPSEDGLMIGQLSKVTSGAPLGDESKYIYTTNWNNVTIGLGSAFGDSLSISSVSNSYGVQVYRVDTFPFSTSGLSCPVPFYFGAFVPSNNNNSSYKTFYYYDFNNGIVNLLNEDQTTLFKRNDATILNWVNSNATLNIMTDDLEKENEAYRGEYILAAPINLQTSPDTFICPGDSVQMFALGASDYIWSPSTNLSCIACSNPVATPEVTTSYFVTGMAGNCTITDTINITVSNTLSLTLTSDTNICIGDSIQLFANGASNYYWSPAVDLSCTNCIDPIADPTTSTLYFVVATLGNCSVKDSVFLIVDSIPKLLLSADTSICLGDQIELIASGATSYSWTPSSGLSCSECANPIASPIVTTIYLVTGYNGACSSIASASINVSDLTIDAGESQIIGEGSSVQLNGSGAETYSWSPGNSVSDSTISSPIASPFQSTTYTLTGTGDGCTKSDTVTLTVVDPCKFMLLPSAFSPNQDGVNDQLKIISITNLELYYFRVFNRWGELIFETNNLSNGWDGTYKGIKQNIGSYVYAISFDCKGTQKMKSGNVTLLR
ncbi:MAG: LamG-like jellyroll fold domain-containing protein [Chitinophagales bacterium]